MTPEARRQRITELKIELAALIQEDAAAGLDIDLVKQTARSYKQSGLYVKAVLHLRNHLSLSLSEAADLAESL